VPDAATGPTGDVSVLHVDPSSTPDLGATRPFRDADISVDRVSRARDAVESLGAADPDCVVAEHDLPRTTGTELLDAVREAAPSLPFVFYTTSGLDAIPTDAVTAGPTDYVRKDRADRRRLLAARVGTLVDQYRLRRRLDDHRSRTDQVRECLGYALGASTLYLWDWDVESGTVDRYPRLDKLFDTEGATLEPVFGGFTGHVHPDHRDEVVATLRDTVESGGSYQVQYRLEIDDGPVWLDERGVALTADGGPDRVVGVTVDVSRQRKRERELRWERELNRTLHETLIESRTRSDLERRIVEQLHDHGYDLVWIGDLLLDEIDPRATAGRDGYVDDYALGASRTGTGTGTGDATSTTTEPIGRAIETETAQFVDDLRPRAEAVTDWSETAAEWGFRAGAALPLIYQDVLYGVLAVYDDEPTVFDPTTRRLLSELADTLAFVIHNVEQKNALASDRVISATLQLVGADYYLADLIRSADYETSDTRLVVHETLQYDENRNIQYVSVNGASNGVIADAAADHPAVDDVTTIAAETQPRLQILHREETPETTLTTVGTRVRSTSVTARRVDVLVEVPSKTALSTAIETLDASNESVSILSSIEQDRGTGVETDPLDDLTDRQATVLRAAYHRGYFEQPRESSATEVAESLGISHPTLLEHLRLAQQQVLQRTFE
jgi:predicted DNA binding protein/PAS domain-containing protein